MAAGFAHQYGVTECARARFGVLRQPARDHRNRTARETFAQRGDTFDEATIAQLAGRPMFSADLRTLTALAISSVVGIVVGDTYYFRSLQILGPRRALIVSTTSPLFAVIAGWVVLGETLTWVSFAGILLTLTGIAIVISERGVSEEAAGHFPGSAFRGIVMGLIGSILNAGGATFSRLGTSGNEALSIGGCDPLEATVIRVCVAATGSVLAAFCVGQLMATARKSFDPAALKCYLPPSFAARGWEFG